MVRTQSKYVHMRRPAALLCCAIMSFIAFVRDNAKSQQPSPAYVRQHKNHSRTIDADIDEGLLIQAFALECYGSEDTADFVQHAAGASCGRRMPYGFWRKYMEQELEMKFCFVKRQALRRSFQ